MIENPENAEWKLVKKFIKESIDIFHKDLESLSDERQSDLTRGKIAFARDILKLEGKSTNIEVPIVDYSD